MPRELSKHRYRYLSDFDKSQRCDAGPSPNTKEYAADYDALPPSDAREAYTLFMNVFAETGSLSDVITTAWLRSRRGVLAGDLREATELFVRASRSKVGRTVRSWLRSEPRRNAGSTATEANRHLCFHARPTAGIPKPEPLDRLSFKRKK